MSWNILLVELMVRVLAMDDWMACVVVGYGFLIYLLKIVKILIAKLVWSVGWTAHAVDWTLMRTYLDFLITIILLRNTRTNMAAPLCSIRILVTVINLRRNLMTPY